MPDDSFFKAGVIGLGVGERHISGFEQSGLCQVTSICDIDPRQLENVARRNPGKLITTSPNAILDDPEIDIVSIASFDNYHHHQVVRALQNGKHVFVEKPLCLTEDEFTSIGNELQKRPNLKLSSNLILRKTPRFKELRSRIQEGQLGMTYYMEGDYDYGRLHKLTEGWRGTIPFYSVVHGGAIHLIDLIYWLTEKKPVSVFAMGAGLMTRNTQFRFPDLATALLRCEDESIMKISANFGSVTPHHHKLSIYGSLGTFEQSHRGAHYMFSRDREEPTEICTDAYPGAAKGDMIPSFIQSISDDSKAEVEAQEVMDVMSISLAIQRSMDSGIMENVKYFQLKRRN